MEIYSNNSPSILLNASLFLDNEADRKIVGKFQIYLFHNFEFHIYALLHSKISVNKLSSYENTESF